MKRTSSFRVRKRDGRTEWLRATKLLRSIGAAIAAARGEEFVALSGGSSGEEWRAMDLTTAVLTGLRERHGSGPELASTALAEAVQQAMLATGFPRAAEEYARVGGEQRRRRSVLQRSMGRPFPTLEHPDAGPPILEDDGDPAGGQPRSGDDAPQSQPPGPSRRRSV